MKTVVSRGDQHPLPDSRAFADMTPRRPHYDIREATSLAAVFCGKSGQFQMERIPTPAPNAGEVLVRIDGCLLSRRSLEGFDSVSARNVRRVFGYENCGTIEALGEGVSSVDMSGNPITIGSRVCGRQRHAAVSVSAVLRDFRQVAFERSITVRSSAGMNESCLVAWQSTRY